MPHLRLALAQLNTTVGAVEANADAALEWCRAAARSGADLVLLPEMALTGYPVEDLALRTSFVDASVAAVGRLAERLETEGLGGLVVVVGHLDRAADRRPENKASVLHGGRVLAGYEKHHLPNYGVFDEYRYFRPGTEMLVVRVRGVDVALAICEDLWQDGGPVQAAAEAGAGLLAVVNASPYESAKDDVRLELVRRRAAEVGCPLAYVNLVGGQDELVFDGDSMVVAADGEVLARGPQFVESLVLADLELAAATATEVALPVGPSGMTVRRVLDLGPVSTPAATPPQPVETPMAERLDRLAEIHAALVLGLRDYCAKNGIRTVFLGLSGGIDSTLVASIACDALGAENVHGISNPGAWSSEHSRSDAAELARRTGLHFSTVEIAPMVDAFEAALELDGVAAENLQARVRAVIWMARSNQDGPSIVLACGNKTELAVGYSTIYGDAVGGFAPIKDVPKTLVWELARWRNEQAGRRGETPPVPEGTITKEPSAELRPGQRDTDTLPPYEVLDRVLESYVGTDTGLGEMVAAGFDAALVQRVVQMVDRAEYKRRQYPPGTKISFKAFGRDRRLPITNGWRETDPGRGGVSVSDVTDA
ncbi:NAD+ synthase [Auraticoccus monumenti]|uniref:Glutamine-dependent NAD(+) synthetase n=1 Tax=Auraticoccus monumenti TaxID=675864 RepID=A0A1G7DYQ8_9ACTN|nr:NAD+ synthase [Auraticoccus monumenti]SDE56554.1 NAD+ synthase (glutamine-hydrolysing) [Auraticoccus monumenti]